MKLENHIVTQLLTNEDFWTDMVIGASENDGRSLLESTNLEDNITNYVGLYDALKTDGNRTYFVTNSVIEKLNGGGILP